jgi:hypothetical protein
VNEHERRDTPLGDPGALVDPAAKTQPAEGGRDEAADSIDELEADAAGPDQGTPGAGTPTG